MTIQVSHAFVSAIADGADATLVRPSNWNAAHPITGATNKAIIFGGSGGDFNQDSGFLWDTTTKALSFASDLSLVRDAANILAQRNAANAQMFRVYNFFTDASNYERLELGWDGSSNCFVQTAKAGTGAARNLFINADNVLILRTAGVSRWNVDNSGNFIAQTDNTYDIGAFGANRPRNIYVGTSANVGVNLFLANDGSQLFFGFANDAILTRDAANTLALRNGTNAQTFRIYRTYTDSSNGEWLEFGCNAFAGSNFYINATGNGTGAAGRELFLITASNQPIHIRAGGTTRWDFDGASGHFFAATDNSYDIGASGASRPRNIYSAGQFIGQGTNPFSVNGNAEIGSPGSGQITLRNTGSGLNSTITLAGTAIFQFGAADAAAPVAQTFQVQSVVTGTSNTAGVDWTIKGSAGTGTGAGGKLIFQTAPAAGSGSSPNTFSTAFTIDSNIMSRANGSFSRNNVVTKTADFTLGTAENWVINNKAAATCTVTLPSASTFAGREVHFQNNQAQTLVSNASNVVPKGGGAAGTAILPATATAWAILVSDGTNWVIMLSGT